MAKSSNQPYFQESFRAWKVGKQGSMMPSMLSATVCIPLDADIAVEYPSEVKHAASASL